MSKLNFLVMKIKNILALFLVFGSLISCKQSYIAKPKTTIEKDKMINIIYDLSLLEAIKTQNVGVPTNYPTSTEFLKTKYKVDSLTFADNVKYYAADVENYKKMYEEVQAKLKKKIDSENGVGRIIPPKADEGVVK